MPAIKLQAFGGMIPAQDDRLLPDNMAAYVENAWLYAGTLEGIREPKLVHTCSSSQTKRVFRIPKQFVDQDHIIDSWWMEFPYKDVDVVHSPTANDTYQRFYWAGDPGGSTSYPPSYNTTARIAAGSSAFILGVPAPTVAPTVTPSGGSSSTTVSRAYVYTWITAYGEEGPPSPPTVTTGKIDDTWTIGLTAPGSGVTTGRNLDKVRIYRTVTSSAGVATYFYVGEVTLATTTYADTATDTTVSGNNQLESTNWTPPPSDMKGMAAMPNGMIVGFRDNELWFCEPYHPHAWPAIYTLSVGFDIVGIGVIGQTVIVCTEAATYAATGINPASVTLSKLSSGDACLSRGSIVSTPGGVVYATSKGLALATPAGVANATDKLFSKDKWLETFKVQQLRGARLGDAYYAFGSIGFGMFQDDAFENTAFETTDYTGSRTGGIINAGDARTAFWLLSSTAPTLNIYNDPWSSELLVLRDGKVYWIDISSGTRGEYTWRSKRFQTPNRRNLEAMKIYYDNPEGVTSLGTVKIYADDRLVSTRPLVKSGQAVRLPSGFKADFWQVEITSRVIISNIQMATSVKELASV